MERIKFIDISKGLAIIFIVLGHVIGHATHCTTVYKILYSFHVVLFFVLAGYTFNVDKYSNFIQFFKKKFKRIMIPFFIWEFLFLLPYFVFGGMIKSQLGTTGEFNLISQLLNILYGNGNASALKQNSALWFLPALFSMEICFYFIIKKLKLVKRESAKYLILLLLLFLIGYITTEYIDIVFPWGINTVLNLGIFFYIGYLFNYKRVMQLKCSCDYLFLLITLIVGISVGLYNRVVLCINYQYGNYLLFFISSILISFFIIKVSYLIENNRVLQYIGKNTMGILIFHKIFIIIFQSRFGMFSKMLINSNFIVELTLGLFVTFLSVILSILVTKIIKKIYPNLI